MIDKFPIKIITIEQLDTVLCEKFNKSYIDFYNGLLERYRLMNLMNLINNNFFKKRLNSKETNTLT